MILNNLYIDFIDVLRCLALSSERSMKSLFSLFCITSTFNIHTEIVIFNYQPAYMLRAPVQVFVQVFISTSIKFAYAPTVVLLSSELEHVIVSAAVPEDIETRLHPYSNGSLSRSHEYQSRGKTCVEFASK